MALKSLWAAPGDPLERRAASGGVCGPGLPVFSPIDPDPHLRLRRLPSELAVDPAIDVSASIGHAIKAVLAAVEELDLLDPMLPAAMRFGARYGATRIASPILGAWRLRLSGHAGRGRETPWELGFDAVPGSQAYDTPSHSGALWQPRELDWLERDPTSFGQRLVGPIALAENIEFLAGLEEDRNAEVARAASELLREIQPFAEADLGGCVVGDDPWRDTFALWLLVRRPRALARLHPLAIAIATRYGTLASRLAGLVAGVRHPFEGVPLVSANAHLGVALWALDYRPSLLPGLVAFVRSRRRPNGGFGEDGQPADVLTTLAAGDLLAALEPDFDPRPTAAYFATAQEPAGWWRALDPEVPWLTGAVADWLTAAEQPFAARFRWPEHQRLDLDRKTGVPGYGAFDRIARVFDALPGLSSARVELAFSDLVRFREFNNRFGQDMGDRALRFFAGALAGVGAAMPIRDGGDEFMVVGAPTRTGLLDDLLELCSTWPARFRDEFGADVPAVAPRFVVATTTGRELAAAREQLGRAITGLKEQHPNPGPTGVIRPL